jgi:predicted RNA-binding Zn-ribbon protein involved in translation (DUF1610 family)
MQEVDLGWLDKIRERVAVSGNAAERSLLQFVDVLLEQLVLGETRRAAVCKDVEEQVALYGSDHTWECHACGERRPDAFISVAHRKVRFLAPRGEGVSQINARYCNDRPDCLRKVPDWLDRVAKPLVNDGAYRPANMDKPPLRVHHLYLQPFEALMLEPERGFKVLCPLCGGLLMVYRNQETMVLARRDRCVRCGQLYIYLDETIEDEPLEPLSA